MYFLLIIFLLLIQVILEQNCTAAIGRSCVDQYRVVRLVIVARIYVRILRRRTLAGSTRTIKCTCTCSRNYSSNNSRTLQVMIAQMKETTVGNWSDKS